MRRALLISLFLSTTACSAPPDADLGTTRQGVLDGIPAPDVNEVLVTAAGAIGPCTGVLVAPHVVLASAQCSGAEGGIPPCADFVPMAAPPVVNVAFGADLTAPATLSVTEVLFPDLPLCHDDVALLVLSQAVAPRYATPRAVRSEAVTAGEAITVVGYGATTSLGMASGVKTSAAGTVSCVNHGCGYDPQSETAVFLSDDVHGCIGDAGAPVFDENGDVVGLGSFGPPDCGDGPSGYTHVTPFADWILNTVATVPLPAEVFDPSQGAVGGGPPGTGGSGGVGGAGGAEEAMGGMAAAGGDATPDQGIALTSDEGGCHYAAGRRARSRHLGWVVLALAALALHRRRRPS